MPLLRSWSSTVTRSWPHSRWARRPTADCSTQATRVWTGTSRGTSAPQLLDQPVLELREPGEPIGVAQEDAPGPAGDLADVVGAPPRRGDRRLVRRDDEPRLVRVAVVQVHRPGDVGVRAHGQPEGLRD